LSGIGSRRLNDWEVECIKTNLFITLDILEKHNFKYWLDYGSLLGAVRDGKIIRWDLDSDIGVMVNDLPLISKHLKRETDRRVSFKPSDNTIWVQKKEKRKGDGDYKGMRKRGTNGTDLFGWERTDQHYKAICSAIARDGGSPIKHELFDELEEIEFEGRMVKCPKDPKKFVQQRQRYGPECVEKFVYKGHSGKTTTM